jgi:hypothetical protein
MDKGLGVIVGLIFVLLLFLLYFYNKLSGLSFLLPYAFLIFVIIIAVIIIGVLWSAVK